MHEGQLRFIARVNGGVITFASPGAAERFYKLAEGKRVEIEILEGHRSLSQNALYWVYLEVICEETGNESAEDLHEYFKQKLLPRRIAKIKGRSGEYDVEKITSTTSLTKSQFSEYMEKIERLTGVAIPDMQLAGYISN
jgi:hypothetical protein